MSVHAHLAGVPYPHHISKQGDVSQVHKNKLTSLYLMHVYLPPFFFVVKWLQLHFNKHKERTLHWKKSKTPSPDRYLGLHFSMPPQAFISRTWNINKSPGVEYYTLSTRNVTPAYCIDYGTGEPTDGTAVNFADCYPSPSPLDNRDPAQHWVWADDSTVRPASYPDLCLAGYVVCWHNDVVMIMMM